MNEKTIDQEQVRQEHLAEVHQPRHWAYVAGVIGGGTLLMFALMAFLGQAAA